MMDKLWQIHGWFASIVLAPIVLLHEVTHMAACLLCRAKIHELFVILGEDNYGIRVWGVHREDVGGYRDFAITLAPLIWLPIGWMMMDISVWFGLYLALTGLTGVGDVLHLLHYTGVFTTPGLGLEEFDELNDDRITLLRFSGRTT